MNRESFGIVACLVVGTALCSPSPRARELTFEERVRAQEAIERVYYSHQIGAKRSFADAVPRAVVEKKVRDYLSASADLTSRWRSPVTTAALERELRRITENSRLPERLVEILAALDHDPELIRECFVRPVLVDRLSRSFSHADAQPPALAASLAKDGATGAVASCGVAGAWAPTNNPPDGRSRTTMIWTGSEAIVWGGGELVREKEGFVRMSDTGGRYDPLTDTWKPTASLNAPSARFGHTAVWTGTEMIVWGGIGPAGSPGFGFRDGGRYDPVADSWTPVSTTGAPPARGFHSVIWTGTTMIVWGGSDGLLTPENTGGVYDPHTNTWSPTSTTDAPSARDSHTAVWTGTEMVVWGGGSITFDTNCNCPYGQFEALHDTGGRYDPAHDKWTPMSTTLAPSPRAWHSAVWTGQEMLVWGGGDESVANPDGARYDPVNDSWSPLHPGGAPSARVLHTSVWTGTELLIWSGVTDMLSAPLRTGSRYDPIANTWTAMTTAGAPAGRVLAAAAWTGDRVVVFGGAFGQGDGARYDPAANLWTPMSAPIPSARSGHSAVWTGNLMIVWGGQPDASDQTMGTLGARYDPLTDSWTSMSIVDAPSPRFRHTAVWTGSLMIVWGGWLPGTGVGPTGGRYDPIADTWAPTSTTDAPATKDQHTAVWTGTEMIVWGGFSYPTGNVATGGRYNPVSDTWQPTTMTGAPSSRRNHTAVFTGSKMIVWGGNTSGATNTNTGGRYDPATDTWLPTSTTAAPTAQSTHGAVWSGTQMIVFSTLGGGRYNPGDDTWTAMSMFGAPNQRDGKRCVWTGDALIVWGDEAGDGVGRGGIYRPSSNSWQVTQTEDAPAARYNHTLVWTGASMIAWGGDNHGQRLRSGGIYRLGVDTDSDGYRSCEDCNDNNPSVWSAPGEVTNLLMGGDKATITWTEPVVTGGAQPVLYDTLRSSSPGDFTSAACIETDDGTDGQSNDPAIPAASFGFYYLVRAGNTCPAGEGPLGPNGSHAQRFATACP